MWRHRACNQGSQELCALVESLRNILVVKEGWGRNRSCVVQMPYIDQAVSLILSLAQAQSLTLQLFGPPCAALHVSATRRVAHQVMEHLPFELDLEAGPLHPHLGHLWAKSQNLYAYQKLEKLEKRFSKC